MTCDELVKESMASMRDQAHTVWREIAEQSYHFARHEKVSDFLNLFLYPVALYVYPNYLSSRKALIYTTFHTLRTRKLTARGSHICEQFLIMPILKLKY